jgi:hypothetical protein
MSGGLGRHLGHQPVERGQVLLVRLPPCRGRGEPVQGGPQRVDLLHVLGRHLDDGGAAVPAAAHQPLPFQPGQPLPDRAAADPEAGGQLHLAQGGAGREAAVEDRRAHQVGGFVGQPAPGGLRQYGGHGGKGGIRARPGTSPVRALSLELSEC